MSLCHIFYRGVTLLIPRDRKHGVSSELLLGILIIFIFQYLFYYHL